MNSRRSFSRIIIFTTLIVLLAYGFRSQRESYPEVTRFDINRNGKVDCDDAILVVQKARTAMAASTLDRQIDFNSDGYITVADVSLFSAELRKQEPPVTDCQIPPMEK